MKTIYFVRHGESEGNVGPIGQIATTPLTEKGKEQAVLVAERCAKLTVDVVICSTMVRARQTADAILKKLPKPTEYSDLFVERRRPSVSLGTPKDHPLALEAEHTLRQKFHLPGFRHSDEENFDDLKERVRKSFEYLAARPEENILVVTHGLILRVMLAYLLFGEKLTGEECRNFMRSMGTENTGISVFRYDETRKDNPWGLWIWNDHAHLG